MGHTSILKRINVDGTARIVECALKRKAKLIHISTTSVSGNSFGDIFDINQGDKKIEFDERCLYLGQPLGNVYVHSKFEAEHTVFDAMLRGLNAKIVRIGNLTNRKSDLKFQPNYQSNAFLTRIKAGLELGNLPDYLMDKYAEFSPIDQTAEGILLIAEYADKQNVFHLYNDKGVYFNCLVTMLNKLGIRMKVLPGQEFNQMIQELVKKQETEYIYQAFQNDLNDDGNLAYDGNIHLDNEFTIWFLRKLGFEWMELDQRYLSGYIDYFRELEYFKV